MPVRLNEVGDGAISADKMRCGQIAVIADGPYEGAYCAKNRKQLIRYWIAVGK